MYKATPYVLPSTLIDISKVSRTRTRLNLWNSLISLIYIELTVAALTSALIVGTIDCYTHVSKNTNSKQQLPYLHNIELRKPARPTLGFKFI